MQFSTCLKILKVTKNFGAILRENFFKESSSVRVHQKENRTSNINFNNQQEQTMKLAKRKKTRTTAQQQQQHIIRSNYF